MFSNETFKVLITHLLIVTIKLPPKKKKKKITQEKNKLLNNAILYIHILFGFDISLNLGV